MIVKVQMMGAIYQVHGRRRSDVSDRRSGDAGNQGGSVNEGNGTAEGEVSPSAWGNGESPDNPDTAGNRQPDPTQAAIGLKLLTSLGAFQRIVC